MKGLSGKDIEASGIMPGAKTGEEFMAVLLYTQKSKCKCPSCLYFRGLADGLIKKHVKGSAEAAS